MKYYSIPTVTNSKNPACAWKDKANWTYYNQTPKSNHLILTGNWVTKKKSNVKIKHNNGLIVLDIDYTKDEYKDEPNDFVETFGDITKLIAYCNTYTVKTAGGGYHLYFKYTDDLPKSLININKTRVDLLSNDHLCVGVNTVFNGKKYTAVHNKSIKDIPVVVKNYIVKHSLKKLKKTIKIKKTNDFVKQAGGWAYNMSKHFTDAIVDKVTEDYLGSYENWLKFTTFCKVLNLKQQWIDKSKMAKGFDAENNETIWQNIDANAMTNMVAHFVNETDHKVFNSFFRYAPTQNLNKTKPNKTFESKKLGYTFMEKNRGNLIIKSDTGTGKTTTFKHYIKKCKTPFISIVSRVSLAEEQYKAFAKHGIDVQLYSYTDGAFEDGKNYIVQVDSIMKSVRLDVSKYTVFLDEFNSLIDHVINSTTLAKYRPTVFKMFTNILKNCKRMCAVDADVSDVCFKLINHLEVPYTYHLNTYQHNKGVNVYEIDNYELLKMKLLKTKKWLLCCDSASEARTIYTWLKTHSKTVKLYTADETGSIDLDADPCVIFSPKVIYGLDSLMEREVFCFYTSQTINPSNMKQQVARCRNISNLYISFLNKETEGADNKKPPTFTEYILTIAKKKQLLIDEFSFLLGEDMSNIYDELYSIISYRDLCYSSNKYLHFKMLLQNYGFVLNEPDYTKMFFEVDKKQKKIDKDTAKDVRFEGVDLFEHSLNKYLQIPSEAIEEYVDMFHSQSKVQQHFNISKYVFDEEDKLIKQLIDKKDFNAKLAQSNTFKVQQLKKFGTMLGFKGIGDFTVKKKLTSDQEKSIVEFYKTHFRDRSKKECSVDVLVGRMAKTLLGDLVKSKQTMVKGTRKYIYNFDKDILTYHAKLYGYRQGGAIEYVNHDGSVSVGSQKGSA
jgi:hypothetical protein